MTGNGDPLLVVTWTCGGCGRRLRKTQPARIDLGNEMSSEMFEMHRRVEIACPFCDPEVDVGVVEEVEGGED